MTFQEKDRKAAKIHGIQVQVPCPYAEGHTLTANEAEALNAHFVDGVRSRVSAQLKDQEISAEEAQRIIEQAAQEYTFGERGGRPGDPIKTEAMNIARSIVREQLKKKGYNLSDVPDKKITELAKQVVEKNPKIRERAAEVVREREAMASEIEL